MRRLTVLKLGGAAITDKTRVCTPNLPLIQSVAERVANHQGALVLLHGGGSFAHPVVIQAGLGHGFQRPSQLRSITETEFYLDQLTRIIGVSLLLKRRACVPISPMSFIMMKKGQITASFIEPIESALRLGLMPLIHGDIVFDSDRGCGVISADRIASYLAVPLGASLVLFGSDVDGVYDMDPKRNAKARLINEIGERNAPSILRRLSRHGKSDATGGMLGKVKEALRIAKGGCDCYIFNLKRKDALDGALRGKLPLGTRFASWR